MKKLIFLAAALLLAQPGKAWWDPGHMVTAMIAYLNLSDQARARVDELTAVIQRDYPQVNHFIATGPWPDDLKGDGVKAYDSWHYTNLPYKTAEVAIPTPPAVNVVWAINECRGVLAAPAAKNVEKARFLAFLVHFVSDLHQPLHSTSVHSNEQPGGNLGGNLFLLAGNWRNLHALWDDGCGYLSPFNDIRPFNQPKGPLATAQIDRIRTLAQTLMAEHPLNSFPQAGTLDPDFWALESHKLAIQYGYRGVKGKDERGRDVFLQPNDEPTPYYLEQGQKVVRRQLALSGYRLAAILNELFK